MEEFSGGILSDDRGAEDSELVHEVDGSQLPKADLVSVAEVRNGLVDTFDFLSGLEVVVRELVATGWVGTWRSDKKSVMIEIDLDLPLLGTPSAGQVKEVPVSALLMVEDNYRRNQARSDSCDRNHRWRSCRSRFQSIAQRGAHPG